MYVPRLKCNCTLLDLPIAHKGVFGNTDTKQILENSLDSIKVSVLKNIPFEIDIVKTKDNIPIIYHDFTININGFIYLINELKFTELREYTSNFNYICSLEECIAMVNGKVPMILDFKETSLFGLNEYRKNVISLLENYKGEYAIQSFNPFFVYTMGKHLPKALRGQLICRGKTLIDTLSVKHPKFSSNMYEKLMSTICYIAHADYIGLEVSKSQKWKTKIEKYIFDKTDKVQNTVIEITSKVTKKPVIGWTLTELRELNYAPHVFDNYIFEPDTFENYNSFAEEIKKSIEKRKMCN